MFCELLATYNVLWKWKENPSATKAEIGVWYHWSEDTPENRLPLSRAEVSRMKVILRRHAPASYQSLFQK